MSLSAQLKIQNSKFKILNSKGFTLIELLIAITVLAILFGVAAFAAQKVMLKARDNQKISDLYNIQAALQQYYSDQGYYPTALDLHVITKINNCQVQASTLSGCPVVSKIYLNSIPQDPTPSSDKHYCYQSFKKQTAQPADTCDNTTNLCHYYVLQANLEGQAAGSLSCNDKLNVSGTSDHTGNYRVDPLGL
jgi:prepilin-type N-terminal cleavage/methylation domain-containing protein